VEVLARVLWPEARWCESRRGEASGGALAARWSEPERQGASARAWGEAAVRGVFMG
jgi:hypothetical protein